MFGCSLFPLDSLLTTAHMIFDELQGQFVHEFLAGPTVPLFDPGIWSHITEAFFVIWR